MVVRILFRRILYGVFVVVAIWIASLAFNVKFLTTPSIKVEQHVFERNIDLLRPVKSIVSPQLKQRNIFLVIVVLSSPSHFDKRQAIRNTWGNHSTFNTTDVYDVFFLLGKSNGTRHKTSSSVAEQRQYNDIVLGDFNDNYYSLVSKTFLGLRWAMKDVDFKYLLKCDDDVYLNIPRLLKWLHSEAIMLQHNLYAGRIYEDVIPIRHNYKNALSVLEYPRNSFPPYAAGPLYILSRSSVQLILEASREVKPFFIEDAYIGCLAEHAGIQPRKMEVFALDFKTHQTFLDYGACKMLTFCVFGHNLSPSYMKQLHVKVMQFEALDRGTTSFMCFQEWLLYIYKVVAVVMTGTILVFTVMWLIKYSKSKHSRHRRKRNYSVDRN